MHRLRFVLLASLVLALEGYLGVVAYFCPDPGCVHGAYWMLWGLWTGSVLAMVLRCRGGRVSLPVISVLLPAGYGVFSSAVALLIGSPPLAVTIAAIVALTVLGAWWGECSSLFLVLLLLAYDAGVSLLLNIKPILPVVVPVAVLAGLFSLLLYLDAYRLARVARSSPWPVVAALGLILLAIAGFYAAYISQAYRLAAHEGLSASCSISAYCVRLGNRTEIPVASSTYALLYLVQLALTGALLALPVPRSQGFTRVGGATVGGNA